MASSSDKTVSEIVEDVEVNPVEEGDHDEPDLELAEPLEHREGNAFDIVDKGSVQYVQSLEAAREEAQIPKHVTVKELENREIVIARKWAQKAALPNTGELRDGFFCDIIDVETLTAQTVWIGQVALMRDLERIKLPITTTIKKRGRTYIFS